MSRVVSLRAGMTAVALCAAAGCAGAQSFDVSFNDPGSFYSAYYDAIAFNVVAAGNTWARSFDGLAPASSLQVQIGFANIPTANGTSATSAPAGFSNGLTLWEQGAAFELRTGTDPNGASPDVLLDIGVNGYLQNELWFNPSASTASPPSLQTDARSVFLHEFGHALGVNGFRDSATGALFGPFQSTFDAHMSFNDGVWYFTGENAGLVYGGSVPLTAGNLYHYGNASGPGTDLVPGGLMNGVAFSRGAAYEIGVLDLAIMRDLGFATVAPIPEPSTYVLLLLGLAVVTMASRRRTRQAAMIG